ncbi:GHKL domain-containing protein [Flavonifractor plautii]|nr:GHKL domain-containing protein [Flavonifractor plautii]
MANPCAEPVRFENGVPISNRPGHGLGVQSICAIVKRYGGICSFSANNGIFLLRLSL